MKKSLAVLLIAATFGSSALAQTATPVPTEQSKVEALLKATGTLYTKDFHKVATGKGFYDFSIEAIFITNPVGQGTSFGGARLTVGKNGSIGVIDFDEIPGVLAALNFLEQSSKTAIPTDDREISYTTRGGVSIVLFNEDKKWTISVDAGRSNTGDTDYFDDSAAGIKILRDGLTASIAWLTSKGIK